MATNSTRRQKRHQVKSMPPAEPSTIEAWSSNAVNTIDSRRRNSESLHYNPKLTASPQRSIHFESQNSTYSSINKPLPPAHKNLSSSNDMYLHQKHVELRPIPLQHQGNTMKRTISCHPRRIDGVDNLEVKELMRINPLHLFFAGFLPPFFGAVASIIVALILHNDEISNYNWQCGRARLPSLSRIINLPMERIFWQFSFLFHIPLRLVELAVGFHRYERLRSVDARFPRLYTLSRYLYAIVGMLELIFMIALSVVAYHVIFFYAFGSAAIGFFATNVVCHASSLYYLNPYGRLSYYIKLVTLVLYIISVPILLGAFLLYWKKCITYMYDIFALTEYLDVFLSIIYHCCAFFDIRYKVTFSIRRVKRVKYD